MENFKFIIVSVIILLALGLLGFWAFGTLQSGSANANNQEIKALEKENQDLKKEVTDLKGQLASLQPKEEVVTPVPETTQPPAPAPTPSKYQSLINELQQLVTDNVAMKIGSRGTRVGTIQNFLNIYNKTSKRVDNDYGKTTKIDVANFQKAVGLSQTGETGPTTYQKMIDWLKKQ